MSPEFNYCRICKSKNINLISTTSFKPDYQSYNIYECDDCGSRYTFRKKEVHEKMHSTHNSPYAFHRDIVLDVLKLSDKSGISAVENYLSKTAKNKFIIDYIKTANKKNKILEIGCSLGYLTSYFLLNGYDIIGADISATAIKRAISCFGDNFLLIDQNFYDRSESFDIIYHVGTIGCVENPINFIKNNLKLLRSGGALLFNAPDVKAIKENKELWSKNATPPDLITMFDQKIWKMFFGKIAKICIDYEPYSHSENALRHMSKILKKENQKLNFMISNKRVSISNKNLYKICNKFYDYLHRIYYYLSCFNLIYRYKNDFGMHVTMIKE